MASKKGRPQKKNNNVLINDINVEYLSTKVDKFDNSVVYLKLTDHKNKLKPIIDIQANDNDIRLPIWTTETQDVILKVKDKWLSVADDLQPLSNYIINADFTAYSMDNEDGNTLKGYYIKVPRIKRKKNEIDINDDN